MLDATPLLRLYARWRLGELARKDPVDAQRRQLMRLVARAKDTRFGREHGFAGISSVEDYQRAVPLRRYEDFWDDYWRTDFPRLDNVTWPGIIPFFARSSGTSSGATKNIPVSRTMIGANKRAAFDVLAHHLAFRPESRILGGKNFVLGGTAELSVLAPGIAAGDLSGIAAAQVPVWAKRFYFPYGPLARLTTDWEQKTTVLAQQSLTEDIRSISGTPSWLVLFFDELARRGGGARLVQAYPHLEMLVHGGVAFAPYHARFEALLEGSHAETREVYPASEGFIALADRGPGEGLRLLVDNGLFVELVPVEELESPAPLRHWLGNAETGINYAIVLTTCAGLWSYVVGDTVRLVSLNPPRLLITGRISYSLSVFGEHLIGEEIEAGVSAAAAAIGASVNDFTVGPVFTGSLGHHLYVIECAAPVSPDQAERFARVLDEDLVRRNSDYAEHRAGMGAPEVRFVKPGSFAAWMKARGKLGGQNKVPRVVADAETFKRVVAALDIRN